MLEPTFQSLIDKIIDVENSHIESSNQEMMLSRNWEFIFSDWDGWAILKIFPKKNAGGYWIYPMLCPGKNIASLKEQLPNFSISMSSVGYSHVMSGDEHWIEPFWGNYEDFDNAEIPLFFYRQYYGYPKGKENYIEFNQLITHPLDLHWSPIKNSYCKIDNQGEEVEKIKIISHSMVNLILIRRKTLDKLLYLGKWVLVRYFEFNRFRVDFPSFENTDCKIYEPEEYEAKFKIRICGNEYVGFRGAQVERPINPKVELLSWATDDEEEEKNYAKFIVQDWKNKTILKNYSINPRNFANYFTESDLPFETSPIFFQG